MAGEKLTSRRRRTGSPARVPRPASEFDVPLAYGGATALLMCADLRTAEGAARFLSRFMRFPESAPPPTLEELRIAQAIGRGLEYAIRNSGSGSLLRRVYDTMFAIAPKRAVVVAELRELREAHARWAKQVTTQREKSNRPTDPLEFRTSKARDGLSILDARFATLSVETLRATIGARALRPLGMAARLSLQSGAFDDARRENESEAAAIARVKKLYEKACAKQRSHRRGRSHRAPRAG